MLTELHIENLGVIDTLDLVLGAGLTALTGETGAGKTMLVEAINLLVGGRADALLIRPGAAEARVEGRFVIAGHGVDGDEEVVLARVIPQDGRSRAYVNGRLATVATLAEVGQRSVDLHGQHAHQSLLSAAVQRSALDRFGNVNLTDLHAARARLTEIEALLATLGGDERSRAREIDLLRFQVNEITAAALEGADEDQRLRETEDLLADAAAHRDAASAAVLALTDDGGAGDALGTALAALGSRAPFHEIATRLRSVQAELTDAAAELRDAADSIDEDPQRLADVRARRNMLRELQRKYGDSLAEVIRYGDEATARLSELEAFEARAGSLDGERSSALASLASASSAVKAAREACAPQLAAAVTRHLVELAMQRAVVDVSVNGDAGEEVVFLLAANPGEALAPLTRVASGGELARAMLALRLVLSEAPDTLVFDEVDAGIGGSAAGAVGRALAQLGSAHQVLVVTHLAHVAALASTQIVVSKSVTVVNGVERTVASASPVTGDQRVSEIARMLSGQPDSAAARGHAAELLAERVTVAGS